MHTMLVHKLDQISSSNVYRVRCHWAYTQCFCRHIVLAVRHPQTGSWGALGLSRRTELMDKPLTYSSLADLLADYVASYQKWWHTVLRIRIGLPVPHDVMYEGQVRCLMCHGLMMALLTFRATFRIKILNKYARADWQHRSTQRLYL